MLSFRSGGWLVLLAVVLILGVFAWRFVPVLTSGGSRAIGDGENVASYGFDLSTCLIERDRIVAAGVPKDGRSALINPSLIAPAAADSIHDTERGKFFAPGDRVIGVSIGGHARAYSLRILNWHEVVNDTLGSVPIAVTYSPLCDAAVVFDRRVVDDVLTFGVSGLLYNSDLLFYDRRPAADGESLWSQLMFRALTGPAARNLVRLTVIPCQLVQWEEWRERIPETTVIDRPTDDVKRYERSPYSSYHDNDLLRFPVTPLPSREVMPYKTPVVVVNVGGVRRAFPLPMIAERVDAGGVWRTTLRGVPLRFYYRARPATAWVEFDAGDDEVELLHTFWFSWYAMYPDQALLSQ